MSLVLIVRLRVIFREFSTTLDDISESLADTEADDLMLFIGLTNQPIINPSKTGGRKHKRNIHFIRKHSLNPNYWIGRIRRGGEWLDVYKRVGGAHWQFV